MLILNWISYRQFIVIEQSFHWTRLYSQVSLKLFKLRNNFDHGGKGHIDIFNVEEKSKFDVCSRLIDAKKNYASFVG